MVLDWKKSKAEDLAGTGAMTLKSRFTVLCQGAAGTAPINFLNVKVLDDSFKTILKSQI